MLYAYLAAAVVGLVLLAGSFFGLGHDHDLGHGGSGDGHDSPALFLLSARVWTYALAFGGATGLLLRGLGEMAEPWRALTSAAVGLIAAALARGVVSRAAGRGASGTVQAADLVGRTAGVVVPFGAGSTGKVRVRVAEREVDLLATTDDGAALEPQDEVLILELKPDGAAHVTRSPR